ncbi:hypothetical protein [Brevundimonas sp.]|jgi:hypothetical protein|uniref:hypothetical protein n=1 Tax=Brevundimonas sp. TaxID=1871086 RepID=UPI002E0D7A56|nr:hypothetical protein [Brevundimonas sp.]
MRFTGIVAIGALSLAACAGANSTSDVIARNAAPGQIIQDPPLAVPPINPLYANPGVPGHCPATRGVLQISVSPAIARQGQTLTVGGVVHDTQSMGRTPLPAGCLTITSVTPADAARHVPGTEQVVILDDAAPGQTIAVLASFGSVGSARHEVQVVGRDEVVLTGTWRQDRVKCDPGREPGQPLAELKFTDDGKFGATWQPFESYVDYWGSIAFDPATGAVALTPTGGNFVPPLLDTEGKARLDGERRLILEGVYLGDRNERNGEPRIDPATGQFVVNPDGSLIVDRPVCTYEFIR